MDFEPYLRQLSTSNWSPCTIQAYRSDLRFFAGFLKTEGLRITQVTPSVICDYVAHMKALPNPRFKREGLKPASIERRLAAVSGYFDYLRTTSNPRLRNPTQIRRRLRGPRSKDFKGKAVDEVCLEKLFEGVTSLRDRALLSILLTSGLRLSEVQQLNTDSIEEVVEEGPDGRIRTWGTGRVIGKGRKERVFFFDEATGTALKTYLSTRKDKSPALFISERKQRISRRAIQDNLARWARKLNLKHIHPHQLRHSFATRLANAQIDPLVLRELMGHSQLDTTTRYFRLSDQTSARQYFAAMEFLKS